jgi:hypothetical protein
MTRDDWYAVIARIAQEAPVDLDPLLDPAPGPGASGVSRVALPEPAAALPPSTRLWERDEAVAHIGVRVDAPPRDIRRLALRLASMAAERGVAPIILSALPRTGFEQFGFRVERLPEGPPGEAALCEAELRRFWDMAIVLDLTEIERLG